MKMIQRYFQHSNKQHKQSNFEWKVEKRENYTELATVVRYYHSLPSLSIQTTVRQTYN